MNDNYMISVVGTQTVDGESRRLTPDEAIPIEALGEKLAQ